MLVNSQQGHWVRVYQRVRYSVQFSLRSRGCSVGSIIGSITQGRQRIRFSLGFSRIPLYEWDANRQRVLPTHPQHAEINAAIDRIVEHIHRYFTDTSKNIFTNTAAVSPLATLQSLLFPHHRVSTDVQRANGILRVFQRFIKEHTNHGKSLATRNA